MDDTEVEQVVSYNRRAERFQVTIGCLGMLLAVGLLAGAGFLIWHAYALARESEDPTVVVWCLGSQVAMVLAVMVPFYAVIQILGRLIDRH